METSELLQNLTQSFHERFKEQRVILSFGGFLELLKEEPIKLTRTAPNYLLDVFEYFGTENPDEKINRETRFKLFNRRDGRYGPIVGGQHVQYEIYSALKSFVRQGYSNKLILLHGPNGSAKTSTIDSICRALAAYSQTEQGTVYTFNWIFPTDVSTIPTVQGEAGPIGFRGSMVASQKALASYAFMDESKIASKIPSEFKDNPIFLIPKPQREEWLRQWISVKNGVEPSEVEIPGHLMEAGLSKRNQLIFENLLTAYEGDLEKVLRHVQVERFFYSKPYRVGIAIVEPQMSIDAAEKQLTMDKNISNLPSVLHNIRFYESQGELIEANRGMLEFADMLKRPLEAYKYLLGTIEHGNLNLPSSTASLDLVMFGTTNEKHLDAFKATPDFTSFRERFELITVPYLLRSDMEAEIYKEDVRAIAKNTKVAPHSVRLLCQWAVMTRLKKPDPENFDTKYRSVVSKLDPWNKLKLYEGSHLTGAFNATEKSLLVEIREKILAESHGQIAYEGRFGASPREVRAILHRSAQLPSHATLTPMAVFEELTRIVKDKTVFEFLQYEPRGKYHDATQFLIEIKTDFARAFEHEVLMAMSLVEEHEYENLIKKYIDHSVAFVKREKIRNTATKEFEEPSNKLMTDVEKIIGTLETPQKHREGLLNRIAAYKLENPDSTISVTHIFSDILSKIQEHYYNEQKKIVEKNYESMLKVETTEEQSLDKKDLEAALRTYEALDSKYGYDRESAKSCLRFLIDFRKPNKR